MTSSHASISFATKGSLPLVIKELVRTLSVHTHTAFVLFFSHKNVIVWLGLILFYFILLYFISFDFSSIFFFFALYFFILFYLFEGDICVCVFRVSDGTVIQRLSCGAVCGVATVTFSPDGTMLAVAVQVCTLHVTSHNRMYMFCSCITMIIY